jgi:hypothetical protein
MGDHLIVAVNRQQARFFTLEPVDFPELESGPRIVELEALINPEAMVDSRQMYTDSKTGRGTAPQGGPVHGYDDKRDQHLDELRRRFAGSVNAQIRRLAKSLKVRTLVVVYSARMRQFMNPDLDHLSKQGYAIHKVAKNMIKFTPQRIQDQLAGMGLVPEKKRLAARATKAAKAAALRAASSARTQR